MIAGISHLQKLLEDLEITLVDIGSRDGLDEDLSLIRQFVHAIGFEPDQVEAERLSSMPKRGWKSSRHLPIAIGSVDGASTLYVPESPQGASLRPHNLDMIERFGYENLHRDQTTIDISVRTLDSLRSSEELPRTDYLKVDIEGAELEVLQASPQALAECVAIKVECSFLEQRVGQALTWDVAAFLVLSGFHIVDIHDIHRWRRRPYAPHPYLARVPVAYSRGQVAQCDLIAFRWPATDASDQSILRTIVIASALGYFDFGISLLRAFPRAAEWAQANAGVNVEESLGGLSRSAGRHAVWQAIFRSLRELIPLFRSLTVGIPASPAVRY